MDRENNSKWVSSIGGEGNYVAGRDVTVTHFHMEVESVACKSLECDAIIPLEKAERRRGLCISCYTKAENIEHTVVARKNLLPIAPVAFLLCMIGVAHMLINILNQQGSSMPLELIAGFALLFWGFYRTWRGQSVVRQAYKLD